MPIDVFSAFAGELEKQAVSVGKTLAVLRGRMAQGAAVSPHIVRDLEQQAAGAITSPGARRVALGAADDVRLQKRMTQSLSNPVVQGNKDRLLKGYDAAVRRDPGVFSQKLLPSHYDHGPAGMTPKPVAYARVHADSLTGPSQLQDPKGLLKRPPLRPARDSLLSATVPLTPRRAV